MPVTGSVGLKTSGIVKVVDDVTFWKKVTDGLEVFFFPIWISLKTAFKRFEQNNSFPVNNSGH